MTSKDNVVDHLRGMSQAQALVKLYSAAKCSFWQYTIERAAGASLALSLGEAEKVIKRTKGKVDYLYGRSIKVNFDDLASGCSDALAIYDRDNGGEGSGTAALHGAGNSVK